MDLDSNLYDKIKEYSENGERLFYDGKFTEALSEYCGEEPDMEIGPDEEAPQKRDSAKLIQILEGEDVEKYDALLSLAETGGDYNWI